MSLVLVNQGESRVLQLYRLASTKIERHLKVRGEANPYDSRYTDYFERRRSFLWRVRWPGWSPASDLLHLHLRSSRPVLSTLGSSQNG